MEQLTLRVKKPTIPAKRKVSEKKVREIIVRATATKRRIELSGLSFDMFVEKSTGLSSGIRFIPANTAIKLIGKFMKNINRQSIVTSIPPKIGPKIAPKAQDIPFIPIAIPLLLEGNASKSKGSPFAVNIEADNPCTTLHAII